MYMLCPVWSNHLCWFTAELLWLTVQFNSKFEFNSNLKAEWGLV
jgi:hypothetical protein